MSLRLRLAPGLFGVDDDLRRGRLDRYGFDHALDLLSLLRPQGSTRLARRLRLRRRDHERLGALFASLTDGYSVLCQRRVGGAFAQLDRLLDPERIGVNALEHGSFPRERGVPLGLALRRLGARIDVLLERREHLRARHVLAIEVE